MIFYLDNTICQSKLLVENVIMYYKLNVLFILFSLVIKSHNKSLTNLYFKLSFNWYFPGRKYNIILI